MIKHEVYFFFFFPSWWNQRSLLSRGPDTLQQSRAQPALNPGSCGGAWRFCILSALFAPAPCVYVLFSHLHRTLAVISCPPLQSLDCGYRIYPKKDRKGRLCTSLSLIIRGGGGKKQCSGVTGVACDGRREIYVSYLGLTKVAKQLQAGAAICTMFVSCRSPT